jgi:hypothetical protein
MTSDPAAARRHLETDAELDRARSADSELVEL